jgi:hypothetical protein
MPFRKAVGCAIKKALRSLSDQDGVASVLSIGPSQPELAGRSPTALSSCRANSFSRCCTRDDTGFPRRERLPVRAADLERTSKHILRQAACWRGRRDKHLRRVRQSSLESGGDLAMRLRILLTRSSPSIFHSFPMPLLLLVLHTFVGSTTPRNFGLVPSLERSSHFVACSERGISLLVVIDWLWSRANR